MLMAEPFVALVAKWREEGDKLRRRYADERQAHAYEQVAQDLEETLRATEDKLLDLQEAALISGYSADHLGRLVREGTIPNAGRKHAPQIRLRDLPTKRQDLHGPTPRLHLTSARKEQIARSIASQN